MVIISSAGRIITRSLIFIILSNLLMLSLTLLANISRSL